MNIGQPAPDWNKRGERESEMRTIGETIDDVRDGKRPEYEELLYSLCVMATASHMDGVHIRQMVGKGNLEMRVKMLAKSNFDKWKAIHNANPIEYLGDDIPSNPEYQDRRDKSKKLLDHIKSQNEKATP